MFEKSKVFNGQYHIIKNLISPLNGINPEDIGLEELLKRIKESTWYTYDLTDEQKTRFDEFMKEPYDLIFSDDCLYEYESECEMLKSLKNATENEYMWIASLYNLKESDFDLLDCEEYELYDIGKKAPCRFFIILYMLSVVANSESEKGGEQE